MDNISVIIACVNGLPSIDECLGALTNQRGGESAEIIVANCSGDGSADHIRRHFPEVKLIDFPERLGIPELRYEAFRRSSGDIIAVIEDHCMVNENWLGQIRNHLKAPYAAVGGPIVNGSTRRLRDWAAFLTEYSGLMPPVAAGETDGLAGNNVAYRRSAFELVNEDTLKRKWEFFVQREMKSHGARFLMVPEMQVSHKKEFGFFYFLSQRFHYSRSFAGMRREMFSFPMRLIYAFASPALMGLMFYRFSRQVLAKKKHLKEFLLSLPLLWAYLISYASGEFVGYLAGGGRSILKVE